MAKGAILSGLGRGTSLLVCRKWYVNLDRRFAHWYQNWQHLGEQHVLLLPSTEMPCQTLRLGMHKLHMSTRQTKMQKYQQTDSWKMHQHHQELCVAYVMWRANTHVTSGVKLLQLIIEMNRFCTVQKYFHKQPKDHSLALLLKSFMFTRSLLLIKKNIYKILPQYLSS